MKNVIIYKRVSTEEQADKGFSLASQEELLTKFCASKGLNIIKIFTEDFSAWKGFDRPAYNQLKSFIQKNKRTVDAILFTQWSRFSREYTEAVIEIKNLKSLGVEPNAIEQWIDFLIPENLYMLAIYLAAPQVENDRLSLRTKAGMRQALKEGRWLWKAPFGYRNNKLTKLIEIEESSSKIVQFCFEQMATGLYAAEEVRRKAKGKGLHHCKQSFIDMLQNVMYLGKILVPSNKDEAEKIVKGLHQPIITADIFDSVQMVLKGKKKPYKGNTKKSETHLVGHLYCPKCEKPMTGSGSKGNGGIYHYYHCQRKYGCNNNFRANNANKVFEEYLSCFQPEQSMIELYKRILEDVFKTNGYDRENEKSLLKSNIVKLEQSISDAAMKNLNGIWDDELFLKTKILLDNQKNKCQVTLDSLNKFEPAFSTYLSNSASLFENLTGVYKEMDSESKKKLIGSIFPEKIYFENNSYRTTKINEVMELICNMGEAYKEKSPALNARLSSVAPPARLD